MTPQELTEADIEAYARRKIREAGGWLVKTASPGMRGFPDDICFWPHIGPHHLEIKSPTGRLSAAQIRVIKRLTGEFHRVVLVLSSKYDVDCYIKRWGPRGYIHLERS